MIEFPGDLEYDCTNEIQEDLSMRLLESGILRISLFLLCVCPVGGGVTTRPADTRPAATRPATPSTDIVGRTGLEFLKGLDTFLILEHRDRKEADRVLWSVSGLISDEPLTSAVAMKGYRLSDLSEKEANLERKELASTWASIINFYAGFIEYKRMRVVTFSKPGKPDSSSGMAHVLFPAMNPAFPHPVNILVLLIQEKNTWKVKSITLLPGQPKMPTTKPG